MCFLQKCTSWIRVEKKSFWRASSRGGNVQVTSERVSENCWKYFFLPDVKILSYSISGKAINYRLI